VGAGHVADYHQEGRVAVCLGMLVLIVIVNMKGREERRGEERREEERQ